MAGHGTASAAEKVTSVFDNTVEHVVVDEHAALDEQTLNALGYKQEFKRDFSLLETFSVSFSVLALLPSIASTISYSLGYAGTAGAIYGWIIAGIMIQAVAFSMAELCSSMPTAGGLYYAAAVLAPAGWGPLCSWIVGWSNFLGFLTAPCALNYALASMIATAAQIANPEYIPKDWHIYLLLLLLIILQGLTSIQRTKVIGMINDVGMVWNFIVLIMFLIWFPAGSINSPKTNDSHTVWTEFTNRTEWPIGWATIMGFLTTLWTLAGYDSPFHLAEECSNANIASPRAIVMTAQLGVYLGFAIILVIVYTVKDIAFVIAGPYSQPFGALCLQVLGKKSGLAMFGLNMIAQYFCGQAATIIASRILFAYSRDGAIPGSRYWATVNKRTKTPVNGTGVILAVSALLGLLLFGGPIVISAIFSIGAIAQYTSFITPIFLKLFFDKGRFKPGPWNLGKWSRPVNAVACAWWLIIAPALCFPAVKGADLTPETMNWTILIYFGPMLIALAWYGVSARHWFKGPRINVSHLNQDAVHDSATAASHGSTDKGVDSIHKEP